MKSELEIIEEVQNGLKQNNLYTGNFISNIESLKIKQFDFGINRVEGLYSIKDNEILVSDINNKNVIRHELVHCASTDLDLTKISIYSGVVTGQGTTMYFDHGPHGKALNEGITDYIAYKIFMNEGIEYKFCDTYKKLSLVSCMLSSIVGANEFDNTFLEGNGIQFRRMLINSFDEDFIDKLYYVTDKYLQAVSGELAFSLFWKHEFNKCLKIIKNEYNSLNNQDYKNEIIKQDLEKKAKILK